MSPPLITIIIPTFNSASILENALQSAISQTYIHKEIVIIDGRSQDETLNIINRNKEHIAAWVSEKDEGIYEAMNKGILLSKGDYLYFMGSDDTFYSKDVLKLIFTDSSNCIYDLIYGNVINKSNGTLYDGEFNLEKLKEKNICHQAIFTRKKVFDLIGHFNTKYKALADWDFNIKCFANKKIKIKFSPLIIANYNDLGFSNAYFEKGFYQYKDNYIDQLTTPLYIRILKQFKVKLIQLKTRFK
jgi:glycosyltransferase involved in cell wall biosynthesis